MAIQNFVLSKEGSSFNTVDEIFEEINSVINNPEFVAYIAEQVAVGNVASSMEFMEGGDTISVIRDWDDAAFEEFKTKFADAQLANKAALEAAGWLVSGDH